MLNLFKTITILLFVFLSIGLFAQDSTLISSNTRLKVYIDENDIDFDYLRNEVDFVDFVNDPAISDVQIILVEEINGSGGINHSIWFNSKTKKNISDFTLTVSTLLDDTQHQVRSVITNVILRGLMPFFNETSSAEHYQLSLVKKEIDSSTASESIDKWKNWVFKLNSSGGFDIEENKSGYNYSFNLKADKITEKFKINNYLYIYNQEVKYTDIDYVYNYNYKYIFSKVVYSLSDHWSTGLTVYAIQSSYHNKEFAYTISQAIEYNFFPWQESNEHIFTLAYALGYDNMHLYNENYRNLLVERAPLHRIYLTGIAVQPWGDISLQLTGSEYLNDLSLYNISFASDVSFRIYKGLSITLSLVAESIHDQIYIPASEYSVEEIVTGARKLPSNYLVNGSIGLTYQFGSIYNNIVNRRL